MLRLLFLFILPFVNCDSVVQTNSGPVRGISSDTKNVEAFLGIPFAEPPVGSLRFSKPVAKSPWKETFNANKLPTSCVQAPNELFALLFNQSNVMSEDCLYLSLWVPKTDSTLKQVLVHIHAGSFMVGSSNYKIYDGAALSEKGDVIVASMNYRVGTLGFFYGSNDEAPGSMGMYDQLMAIQWIKDNARNFGGDPDNIVLFGESAGAFSTSLHMVSPLSKKLYKRAVLEGGSAFNPMYSDGNEILSMASQIVSKHLGCAADGEELKENPKKVIECMKNLPAEKFPEADSVLFQKEILLIPRVGDEFLPTNPIDLFRRGEFKDAEMLISVVRNEGSIFITFPDLGHTIDPKTFNEAAAKKKLQDLMKDEQTEKIVQSYFKRAEEESRYTYLDAVADIMGDSLITCPAVFQADIQSLKEHPVYFYRFDYRSPSSPFPEWAGVTHAEDTQYVFGNSLWKFSEYEEELSSDMMDMFLAFARTGNPNIPGGLKLPKYTYEDPKYLLISKRDSVGVRPDNDRCEAWRKLYRATIDEELIQGR